MTENSTWPEGTGDPATAAIVESEERLVIGLAIRTTNAAEYDAASGSGPIARLWARFGAAGMLAELPSAHSSGEIVAIYTDYVHRDTGEYTCVVGRRVTSLGEIPDGFGGYTVPAQTVVETPVHGDLPTTVGATWQRINARFTVNARPSRTFVADIDVYRFAGDPLTAIVLVGIDPHSR